MAEIEAKIHGLADFRAALKALPEKLRKQVLRNALAAGARLVRDAARSQAPVLRKPDPRRKPGTVKNAIKVRTSKAARRDGNVGVFVNVQPLKGKAVTAYKARTGQAASRNPDDPYYWRWMNFGRQGRAAQAARAKRKGVRGLFRTMRARRARAAVSPLPALRFLERGAQQLGAALQRIQQVLGPAIQKLNIKGALK